MTTTTTRPTQDALFDEPELNEALAAFATLANKISDAAANYITRANKEFNSENPTIHGRNVFILNETVREAKRPCRSPTASTSCSATTPTRHQATLRRA